LGGASAGDLRDLILGGPGDDNIDGGYGNDELRGEAGNDTLAGDFGSDTVIGGPGDDVLTGSALSDLVFGGDGNDFINGGFGFDRVNGGAGADRFFHLGISDHGSDWIQDYTAAEGDVLRFGGPNSTSASDFLIQFANNPSAGSVAVREAFVTQISTGILLWALIDGEAQAQINIQIGADVFDLLA
jgi:Ca2+-binding RTX toxin-like protein